MAAKKLSQDFLKKFAAKEARNAMKEVFRESLRVKKPPRAYPITEEASNVFNRKMASHKEMLQDVWIYIKKHELQDPSNKNMIHCNDELKKLFNVDYFRFTDVPRLASNMIIKPTDSDENVA